MKKRKINIKAIFNLISLIAGSYFVLESFYLITIKPFFSKQLVGFTPLGLVIFIISLFVVAESGRYLYEEFTNKKNKKFG